MTIQSIFSIRPPKGGGHLLDYQPVTISRADEWGGHVQVSMLPKQNGSRARTVVFTQGADATAVATNGKVRSC